MFCICIANTHLVNLMDPDLKYWYQVGLVLENKSKVIISGKWPKLTSKNGALFT